MTTKRLRPSSAARTVQCPASVTMCERYPDTSDPEASEEGTKAHEVALATCSPVPVPTPDGATEEMTEGAWMYREVTGTDGHFERFGEAPQIHAENGGTPDHWRLDTAISTLRITDYKFGHGYVEVFRNWQLINYAAIAEHAMGGLPEFVEFTIVQPRSYHRDGPVRSWRVESSALPVYFQQLRDAYNAALGPNPRAYVGPECKDCPARHACSELQRAGYDACDRANVGLPLDMSPVAVARELQLIRRDLKRLEARETGLAQHAESLLKLGTRVPGFTLEPTMGREGWSVPIEQVLNVGEMFGVPLGKPAALTPKQAIKAGIPADVIKEFAVTPVGALKLAEDGVRLTSVFSQGGA